MNLAYGQSERACKNSSFFHCQAMSEGEAYCDRITSNGYRSAPYLGEAFALAQGHFRYYLCAGCGHLYRRVMGYATSPKFIAVVHPFHVLRPWHPSVHHTLYTLTPKP